MKKLFLLVAVLAFSALSMNAQSIFAKGDKVVNLGVGLFSYLGDSGYKTTIPPISASFETCIKDNLFNEKSSLGVGAYAAYAGQKYDSGEFDWKYSYIILGARGALHYQFVDKLDTYAGLMLGYNIASVSGDGAASAGGFTYSLYAGARYSFSEKFAAFAEVGYGIAAIELGISFKF